MSERTAPPGVFVVSAPSGGGKTSLVSALLERDDRVALSISHTTRPPRPGERDGEHYHFVDRPTFESLIAADAFLEHARVFDHYYGTGRAAVETLLDQGKDVLLDIDWQGARQVRRNYPEARSVFILPPSLEELRARLERRGQDSPEVIERRMRDARAEISHAREFDFLVVNDVFERALDELWTIVRGSRPARGGGAGTARKVLAKLLETR